MKLKVITPKNVKRTKRAQTIRLIVITLVFIVVVSSALIYLAVTEMGRQNACSAIAAETSREC